MSVYIDQKYIGSLSFKLDLFKKKKDDLYNFRCPYCGDSKRNKVKARAFVYRKLNGYFFICHNCGKSTTFSNFLQYMDENQYKQYAFEKYADGAGVHSPVKKPDFNEYKGGVFEHVFEKEKTLKHLENIADLPDGHFAKDYILNRKIPQSAWSEVFYTENFKQFLDLNYPNHGKENIPDDARIILFYKNEGGSVTNVAGRALADSKIRYITVKVAEEKKIFGLQNVDKNKPIYVFEGQFDSLFVPNSVASGDSNLIGCGEYFGKDAVILVFDNEPRNKEIVRQVGKAIEQGYQVCLFPEDAPGKDINEMIQNGMIVDDVKIMINNNTSKDLSAQLRLVTWKKV
jgi:transcription elongation factor Elf1